jgi:hypothetical protein
VLPTENIRFVLKYQHPLLEMQMVNAASKGAWPQLGCLEHDGYASSVEAYATRFY